MKIIELPKEFIVYDMEWTAWEGSKERNWSNPNEHREIFDIGAVLVTGDDFNNNATYRQLVVLEAVPELPKYSVDLTGITQEKLNKNGIPFNDMLSAFKKFCNNLHIYAWGEDGAVIIENCKLKKLKNPFSPDQIHNMRNVFKQHGIPAENYMSSTIVEYFGHKNKHTSHHGLDDALNIVEALQLLRIELTEQQN